MFSKFLLATDFNTLFEWFEHNVTLYREKAVLHFGEVSLSFGQAHARVILLSEELERQGVRPGTAVAVCVENGFAMPVMALACSKLGATVVPIATSLQSHQICVVVNTAKPVCAVVTSAGKEKFLKANSCAEHSVNSLVILKSNLQVEVETIIACSNTKPDSRLGPKNCFVMNFTSGSTGAPKPVCVSEIAKINRLKSATIDFFDLSVDDAVMISTPQYHSLGFRQSLLPFVLGCSGFVLQRFTAKAWVEAVEKNSVSFTIAVSSQIAEVLEKYSVNELLQLTSLTKLVSSSAPFGEAVRENCLNAFRCDVYEIYGSSESGTATIKKLEPNQIQTCSVGRPLSFVKIKLFDPMRRELVTNRENVGEIGIDSPTNFEEYLGLPDETSKAHENGYFLTGDLGYFDAHGELYFCGRAKDTIQNAGITVYPLDIENAIKRFPGITNACAVGIPDTRSNEQIVLAYTAAVEVNENDIYRFLMGELAEWQIPRRLKRVSKIPLSHVGKVDRQLVKQMFM